MNVTTDLSLLTLVSQASLLVKLVLLLLLGVSLVSWWFIFRKAFVLRDTRRKSDDFERARTEWLRRLGFDLRRMAERDHLLFIVRELRAAYVRPALLDDLLSITVSVEDIGRAQFTLGQQVLRGEELLVEASVNLACVDSVGLRPVRVPESLLDTLGSPHPIAAAEEQA